MVMCRCRTIAAEFLSERNGQSQHTIHARALVCNPLMFSLTQNGRITSRIRLRLKIPYNVKMIFGVTPMLNRMEKILRVDHSLVWQQSSVH